MRHIVFAFGLTLLITLSAQAQAPADLQAINRLIDEYSRLEDAGDMQAQAKLMSEDRTWIGQNTGRRTDQSLNMKIQQAGFDALKAAFPDVKWFTDARDRLVKFYGNGAVAIASFYWYRGFVAPRNMPADKLAMLGQQPVPQTVTLVLEKRNANWVIVHSHTSNLVPPNTPK